MTMYVFLNGLFCAATFMLLAFIVIRYRFLVLKPSVVIIFFFHIQIQWAATFQAAYIEAYLPDPYSFLILSQVFPFFGLAVSFFILHKPFRRVSERIMESNIWSLDLQSRSVWILFFSILAIVLIYLSVVPLSRTGIYAIFRDPLSSYEAREQSLKLLNNPFLKYGFSFLKSSLAPMLSVFSMIMFFQGFRARRIDHMVIAGGIFSFAMVSVMLPGARMPGGILILTIILAIFIIFKMPIRPGYIFLSFFLVMGLPVVMTIFREGRELNIFLFFEYLQGGVFKRIFVVPMETGLWHVHYAQVNGFLGVAGVPKLASFLGVMPVPIGNLIYLLYSPYSLVSGVSNTCFVFAYYSFFGILSIVFSWIGLWCLDLAVLVFARIRNRAILLASVAAIGTSSYWFVSTMFTTALITSGFIVILIVSYFLDRFSKFTITTTSQENQKLIGSTHQ
jgi:hypothetical protein